MMSNLDHKRRQVQNNGFEFGIPNDRLGSKTQTRSVVKIFL